MRRPFNRVQIDTFFKHFPQRRQFTQFADFGFNQFCCELDFFFGGHAAESDAQGGMCQFVVAAECAQDVAWFETGRSTGGAARYCEFFHCHNQAFAFDEVEADVQVVRSAVFEVAVDIDFFNAFDAFEEDIAQF